MLGRFCALGKGIKGTVRLGRMSAETKIEALREGLKTELQEEGWDTVKDKLTFEAIALDDLISQKQQIQQTVKKCYIAPAINRAKEGYSLRGLFWLQTQKQLDKQGISEQLKELSEKIDWVNTRQKIFKEIEASPSPIDSCRF